jgi:hypothetical protein
MARVQSERHLGRLIRWEILSRWAQLTTADIEECGTDQAKLIDALQARYGYAKRRAEREVELLFGEFRDRLRMAA